VIVPRTRAAGSHGADEEAGVTLAEPA
jgi:hypothetical protein